MPESISPPLKVFLCHASQDKPAVRNLYAQLKSQSWISPWLDEVNLLPGMDWEVEIFKAIRQADVIIVCLSKESIAKEGYVQKEFKRALGFAEEKPEGAIYIIPLRLDDCRPPVKFQQWQWLDYFQTEARTWLLQSLHVRAESLKILLPVQPMVTSSPVRLPVTMSVISESTKATLNGQPITFGGLKFVRIPAGDFYMGANDLDRSKPEHLISQINYDYYMARFLVTNQQYIFVVRETGVPIIMTKGKAEHPVVNVSWDDAQKYIQLFNKKYQSELPQGYCFCLPTEAEWEKAARGTEGNVYPWGDEFDKNKCNTREGGKGDTTPVGAYSLQGDSPYGCADMSGNVLEWTHSLYKEYPYDVTDGREHEKISGSHVLRGGSFNYDGWPFARAAFRYEYDYYDSIGFRVCARPRSLLKVS